MACRLVHAVDAATLPRHLCIRGRNLCEAVEAADAKRRSPGDDFSGSDSGVYPGVTTSLTTARIIPYLPQNTGSLNIQGRCTTNLKHR